MNICEHLTIPAKLFPDRHAIVFEGRHYTYRELDQLSSRAASLLTKQGVVSGDRVALMLANVPAFVVWYYAALRMGAIALTISSRLVDREVSHVLRDSEPTVFVAEQATISAVRQSQTNVGVQTLEVSEDGQSCNGSAFRGLAVESTWVDASPDDPAAILYTSGTTGVAKGVTLSHMNVRSNVNAFNHLCEMETEDRILLSVPLFHCFGQNALMNSGLNVGATLVFQRSFDPVEAVRLISAERVTKLFGVPAMFQLLHARCQRADLASVSYCFSAAAVLPSQVSMGWQEKFGLPIYEGYGLTETSPFASYNHRLKYVPGSIGSPIDAVEMRIVDTRTGDSCPPGELGEIVIRGPNIMLGYWNRPEESQQSIRNGWFHSGDIGRQDENGFFYIVDRLKDMISVGGLKVYPAEVESVLLDHPAVSQAAVVGQPDEVFGEKVVAFVALEAEFSASDQLIEALQQLSQLQLANYKIPRQFTIVDELPRNASGKVLKTKLRGWKSSEEPHDAQTNGKATIVTESPSSTSPISDATPLFEMLQNAFEMNRHQVAISYLQKLVQALSSADESPAAAARFFDAGLDSLMMVELSNRLQKEIGPALPLPVTLVFDYPRICDLAEFLVEAFNDSVSSSQTDQVTNAPIAPTEDTRQGSAQLRREVESLSEREALLELMQEIENL